MSSSGATYINKLLVPGQQSSTFHIDRKQSGHRTPSEGPTFLDLQDAQLHIYWMSSKFFRHLLYECQSCQLVWQRLFNLITQQTGLNINLTKTNFILGVPLEVNFPVKQAIPA